MNTKTFGRLLQSILFSCAVAAPFSAYGQSVIELRSQAISLLNESDLSESQIETTLASIDNKFQVDAVKLFLEYQYDGEIDKSVQQIHNEFQLTVLQSLLRKQFDGNLAAIMAMLVDHADNSNSQCSEALVRTL